MAGFFSELKRRNVFRVGIAYLVVAWLVLQVADVVLSNLSGPEWIFPVLMMLLGLGLPIAVVLAWAFELTPDGVKLDGDVDHSQSTNKQKGNRLNWLIIVALGLVVVWFLFDEFYLEPREESAQTDGAVKALVHETEKSIAVLPFADMSEAGDQKWFADGLAEEILNSLARTPDLLVASRTSSFKYRGGDEEIQVIAARLGVEHVLEGSVRRAGNQLRVTAQLIRADDGFHLWSANYDREADDVIAIQEEIAIEIAKALETAMDPQALAKMVGAGTRSVEAFEAYLEGRALIAAIFATENQDTTSQAKAAFERAIAADSKFAAAHYALAISWSSGLTLSSTFDLETVAAHDSYDRTMAYFDSAIAAERNVIQKQKYLGEKAFYQSRYRDAEEALKTYLTEFPNDHEARDALSRVYIFLADYDAARLSAQTYEQTIGDDEDQLTGAIINYVWSKDYENAARVSRQALAAGTNNAGLLYQAQRALLWVGDLQAADQARLQYDRITSISDNKKLTMIRQVCANGDRQQVDLLVEEIIADADSELSVRWLALNLVGRTEEAQALLAPLDSPQPPYLISGFLYYPYFDASVFPNFQQVLERENIKRPPATKIPFACPPASEVGTSLDLDSEVPTP